MASAKKYYAVSRGRHPGIYGAWYGTEGAEAQVRGFAGAVFKGFATRAEAQQWLRNPEAKAPGRSAARAGEPSAESCGTDGRIVIYTDGGCTGNPGPGGYAAVILERQSRREISGGFGLTTNNRMELLACIAALESLAEPAEVTLHSDSRYVVNGICKGWARKWRANGWMRTADEAAKNCDLWARLLDLCDRHRIRFVWVHGHAGNPENERCDELATAAARGPDLARDEVYLKSPAGKPACLAK